MTAGVSTEAESVTLFIATYTPGPNWRQPSGEPPPDIQAHIAHQHRQHDEGRLVMGGPFADRPGGMALFKASGLEEVRGIVAADPAVVSGAYAVEVTPWRIALGAPPPAPAG